MPGTILAAVHVVIRLLHRLKAMVGLQPSVLAVVVALVFFLFLAIVGNKLVCGWACPFGALQELVYSLPILRRLKRKKVPFLLSNVVRAGLFVLMLLMLFGWHGIMLAKKFSDVGGGQPEEAK
ncbi:MAG: 4Fe-4S binding protein [Planctomycetota bacterium]|nr:4Fe-4S binding protein [Planctomycetota bacterium]